MINKWALRDLDNALYYYKSIGWCPDTGDYLSDMISLIGAIKRMDATKTSVLDKFLEDPYLKVFLIIHSVFRPDAYVDGEFIENYMANRLMITDEQAEKPFKKTVPRDILKKIAIFEPEIIPFEIHPYRIEYGCRKDSVTGKRNKDPITIIDFDFDKEKIDTFRPAEFISQFRDIAL